MTLPAYAAERVRRVPAINRYLLQAPALAANQPHAAAAVDRRDRQTDGQTPDRYIDPAPHTMLAVSISRSFPKSSTRPVHGGDSHQLPTFLRRSAVCSAGTSWPVSHHHTLFRCILTNDYE